MLQFSPIDRSLASGIIDFGPLREPHESGKSWIELWEPYSASVRRRFADVPDDCTTMAFSPDGRQLAAGYATGAVRVWEVASAKLLAHFQGHRAGVNSLKYFPDGKTLASASGDATILLWKAPALQPTEPPANIELEKLWDHFVRLDAANAYTSMLVLREHPVQVIPYFEKKLHEHEIARTREMPKLIADLNSANFKIRSYAFAKLQELGAPARSALKAALENPPSVEAKRRYEQLLDLVKHVDLDPQEVLVQRVHEAARLVNTPEAARLLKLVPGNSAAK
jgi:hypothetical protein